MLRIKKMINKNLLPQAVVDAVDKMLAERNMNIRDNYIQRIEAIRNFCDQALLENKKKK